ncbi:SIR2 family NAD-dependent protein deacylase [Bacillus pseudomycoides]|uniref:SIR2 family NAD-dependent protein deacylase n=1 Tax=Bacillus pseudomycoides TaxID=64104 RepID=UPI000BF60AD9|nr:SIR2 family protein [Bacillus pseudomycoides]PGF07225.1 SIR2 family protein [Bacillus pseudomycoides]
MSLALSQLISKIRKKEVILWAGAGFSIYTNLPTGGQLASKIISELPEQYHEDLKYKTLPEVAEEFVMLNGGTKRELFRILKEDIDIEPNTLEVHEKLTEIIQIEKIVTTNYDKLFEKAYKNELSVIVNNNQLPLATKRVKLFKVHGDIDQENTMVITTSDYVDFFTSSNRNAAVWKNIEALMNEKSFLFVGYSLDDINVKTLFETMVKNVGEFRHQSFFVSPNLPHHKQQYLRSKGIAYIDMTAEQLVNAIHDEVISNLIKDCEAGFLDVRETNELLKKKGINPKFEFEDGKLKLKSYGAEAPIPLKLSLEESAWLDINKFLFEDIEREELEISQELIKGINSSYNGINLFNHEKIEELKIIKHPDRELDGSFSLRGTNFILENIKCKSFSNETEASIQFKHQSFSLRIKIDFNNRKNQKLHLAVKPSGDILLDYKGLYFLKEWLTQGYQLIFNNMTEKNMIPLGDLESNTIEFDELKRLQKMVINSVNFREKLIQIQEHYGVYLTVPEIVQKEDVEKVQKILFAIHKEKQRISSFKTTFMPYTNMEEIIGSEEKFSFRVIDHNPQEEELFGQVFTLGYPCIETVDGIMEDREKVFLDIKSGKKEIKAVFKSASNEMYFSYQSELPVS